MERMDEFIQRGSTIESDLQEIVDSEQDKRAQKMSALFRRFTDQLL